MDTKAVIVVDGMVPQQGASFGLLRVTALEHVANRPILSHAFDALHDAGIESVVVTGEPDTLLEVQMFLDACGIDARGVEYALRRGGPNLNATLEAVAPLVGESACVLQPGDGLLDAPMRSLMDWFEVEASRTEPIVFATGSHAAHTSNRRFVTHESGAVAEDTVWGGLGLFAPGALVSAYGELSGSRLDTADPQSSVALPSAIATARFEEISGWYRYRGGRQELLELNRIALDRLVTEVPGDFRQSNKLEGRLSIDPTASVRDSVIVGPVVIGPGALVHDAYLGPWTAIGAGARVEGAEVERSIVSPGASITHVGERITSSLIGANARVFKDFSLPRALRLWIGDGGEVGLC